MTKQFGDFQTPSDLVIAILAVLAKQGIQWTRLLEPTCGVGNFIAGALRDDAFPITEAQGIEIQEDYIIEARAALTPFQAQLVSLKLHHTSIYDVDLHTDITWQTTGPLLILGNPPWVTNAALSVIGQGNLPSKQNLKGFKGLDAITGSGNFDITEYIILKLMRELAAQKPTIAMLCKTAVARNVLSFAATSQLPLKQAHIWQIDAKKWFAAAVDACLLYLELAPDHANYTASLFPTLQAETPTAVIGVDQGRLVADVASYAVSRSIEGQCPVAWRQGIKHDAASVMELTLDDNVWMNKLGERVVIEADRIFPLLKSSDLHNNRLAPQRGVIVTQYSLGQETSGLEYEAPHLWAYLHKHNHAFAKRKSTIYRSQPAFSMFGIGPYTFAPYKVAVSGLYKEPKFRLLGPMHDQPVLLDDTCYFLPFDSPLHAAIVLGLLKQPLCLAFFRAVLFPDAKRPVTKKLLQRLDLVALLDAVGQTQAIDRAKQILADAQIKPRATSDEWQVALETLFVDPTRASKRLL